MIILWILVMVCCLYLYWRQTFLFSPTGIFLVYSASVYPVSYLLSYYYELPSAIYNTPRYIPPDKVFLSLLLVTLGLGAFCIGRFVLPSIMIRWGSATINESRLVPLVVVSVIMAVLGAIWVLSNIGGISSLFDNLGGIRSGGLNGLGAGTFAVTALLPTAAQFWLMHAFRKKSKYLGVILLLCLLSTLLGGVFGFRVTVIQMIVQVACICHLMTGKAYKTQTIILVLCMGVLVTVAGYLRIILFSPVTNIVAIVRESPEAVMVMLSDSALTRTRGVEAIVVMTDYMENHNYHFFFENIAETAHSIIPSFIYSKDISLSEKIGTEVYGHYLRDAGNIKDTYGGVSYTLISECFWNMGYVGIVIVCVSLGYILQIVEKRRTSVPVSYMQVIFYKTLASSMIAIVEAPQLGVNGILISLMMNFGILMFLTTAFRVI